MYQNIRVVLSHAYILRSFKTFKRLSRASKQVSSWGERGHPAVNKHPEGDDLELVLNPNVNCILRCEAVSFAEGTQPGVTFPCEPERGGGVREWRVTTYYRLPTEGCRLS
ncbi:hypothetical protein AVEN_165510-1 [Araneus ventricosus]|uniref:Uncharacterized protein n=1 Tax=Araneus ventricosus TaxID=182803 RepID=A0A4Y2K372_ARAVE|nr:hypothetical protein AVEN_165510-1 [Araneus ventricosus]